MQVIPKVSDGVIINALNQEGHVNCVEEPECASDTHNTVVSDKNDGHTSIQRP